MDPEIAVLINLTRTRDRVYGVFEPPNNERNIAFFIISGLLREKNSHSTMTNWNSWPIANWDWFFNDSKVPDAAEWLDELLGCRWWSWLCGFSKNINSAIKSKHWSCFLLIIMFSTKFLKNETSLWKIFNLLLKFEWFYKPILNKVSRALCW